MTGPLGPTNWVDTLSLRPGRWHFREGVRHVNRSAPWRRLLGVHCRLSASGKDGLAADRGIGPRVAAGIGHGLCAIMRVAGADEGRVFGWDVQARW